MSNFYLMTRAAYEKLSDHCVATESLLREHLFGAHPAAETLIADLDEAPVGFALFFRSFSNYAERSN